MKVLAIILFCLFPLWGQNNLKSEAEKSQDWWRKISEEKIKGKTLGDIIGELEGISPLEVDTTSGFIQAIKRNGQQAFDDYLRQLRLYNRIWAVTIIGSMDSLSEEQKIHIFVNAFMKECLHPIDTSIIGGQRADHRIKERLVDAILGISKDKALPILIEQHQNAKNKVLKKYLRCLLAMCGVREYNSDLKNYLIKDADPLIRGWAAAGLGETGDTTAVELLKEAMPDTACYYDNAWLFSDLQFPYPYNKRYYVRDNAAGALKKLGVNVKQRVTPEGFWGEPYIEEKEEQK